jgi:hypothetical protein
MKRIPNIFESEDEITFLLEYEICGSWWVQYISIGWMQTLAGKYFAHKVHRKYSRMRRSLRSYELLDKSKEAGL